MVVGALVVFDRMLVVVAQFEPSLSAFTILVSGQHPYLDLAHTSTVVVGPFVVLGPV